jgi:hypothetical protein
MSGVFPVPKNWRGGDRNGTTLSYNFVEALGTGAVAQYNAKVTLPADTKDIKDDTGDSGERVVSYIVPSTIGSSGRKTAMFASGGALAALGVMLLIAGMLSGTRKTTGAAPTTAVMS